MSLIEKRGEVEYGKAFDAYQRENWPSMIQWLVLHVQKIEATFEPEIGNLRQLLRVTPPSDPDTAVSPDRAG